MRSPSPRRGRGNRTRNEPPEAASAAGEGISVDEKNGFPRSGKLLKAAGGCDGDIWMKPPHRERKRKKSIEAQAVLDKLQEAHLDGNAEVPVKMLCGFWKDQQDAITTTRRSGGSQSGDAG